VEQLSGKIVTSLFSALLFIGIVTLAFNIQPVKSTWTGTVYIRADGSIDPPDAPIQRDGDIYTLTGDINTTTYGIVIYRSNIILEGAGHVLQGSARPYDSGMLWNGDGVILQRESNVTIRNLEIKLCNHGVFLGETSSIKIYGNKITNNYRGIRLHECLKENYIFKNNIKSIELAHSGIYLDGSSNNWIFENNLIECNILLENSTSNRVYENNITEGEIGLSRGSNSNSIFDNKVVNGIIGLFSSHNNTIYQNFVTHDDGYCISLDESSYNNILENNITASGHEGIFFDSSSQNHITGNNISNSRIGIMLHDYSSDNVISVNNILNNSYGIIVQFSSQNNLIYNNNFINNADQVYVDDRFNVWDYGYPCGGNYWSDYNGTDLHWGSGQNETGSDGIGDTAYMIDAKNTDRYPLIAPITAFDAGVWNGVAYNIDVVSNSTLSDFHFNPDEGAFLRFNVTGENGTAGFCRVTIPKSLLRADDGWTITVGNQTLQNYTELEDENFTYLYFTYNHSTQTVTIQGTDVIPEFPSSVTLLELLTLITIPIVFIRKSATEKLNHKRPFPDQAYKRFMA